MHFNKKKFVSYLKSFVSRLKDIDLYLFVFSCYKSDRSAHPRHFEWWPQQTDERVDQRDNREAAERGVEHSAPLIHRAPTCGVCLRSSCMSLWDHFLFPLKWKPWPLTPEGDGEAPERKRRHLINADSLTAGLFDFSFGRFPWKKKRQKFTCHSSFLWVQLHPAF